MRAHLTLLFVIASYVMVSGASYYVESTATSGSNAGTSWANAWTNMSSINWPSLSAGDTVFIAGGDLHRGVMPPSQWHRGESNFNSPRPINRCGGNELDRMESGIRLAGGTYSFSIRRRLVEHKQRELCGFGWAN